MTNFTTRKQELLELLEGYNQSHQNMALYLMSTEEDVDYFQKEFFANIGKNPIAAIYQLRLKKREDNKMELSDFLITCKKDKKMALEGLSQEPLKDQDVKTIEDSGKTEKEIYHYSMMNKNYTILSLLKNWNVVKESHLIKKPTTLEEKLMI
ncbi:hypothetical protein ACTNEO_07090 [Gracilibacillus sp. HCP3S3_G5_1]|uniref:hypothetical protein n=1 Tax=unclassified Gracilibacillus TaxID=2625209 RepID=UPI003F88BB8C